MKEAKKKTLVPILIMLLVATTFLVAPTLIKKYMTKDCVVLGDYIIDRETDKKAPCYIAPEEGYGWVEVQ